MSLVQIAYQTILTKLRDWGKLENKEKLDVLQKATSLMGPPFRQALFILEEDPERVNIYDYQMFYSLILDK